MKNQENPETKKTRRLSDTTSSSSISIDDELMRGIFGSSDADTAIDTSVEETNEDKGKVSTAAAETSNNVITPNKSMCKSCTKMFTEKKPFKPLRRSERIKKLKLLKL